MRCFSQTSLQSQTGERNISSFLWAWLGEQISSFSLLKCTEGNKDSQTHPKKEEKKKNRRPQATPIHRYLRCTYTTASGVHAEAHRADARPSSLSKPSEVVRYLRSKKKFRWTDDCSQRADLWRLEEREKYEPPHRFDWPRNILSSFCKYSWIFLMNFAWSLRWSVTLWSFDGWPPILTDNPSSQCTPKSRKSPPSQVERDLFLPSREKLVSRKSRKTCFFCQVERAFLKLTGILCFFLLSSFVSSNTTRQSL